MNRNLVLITAALALSLPLAGCNKAGKLSTPSTFTPPTGPVELKLKWSPGERVVQDMDMTMNMEMTLPGQAAPMKQVMTMGQEYGLTVLNESPDGGHELEMEFLSVRMGMKMGDKSMIDYDSTKKSDAGQADPVAGIFGKMVGSKIQYYLDASNAVDRMEGVDELMTRLESGAPPAAVAPLKGMFSEGYLKQLMSQNRFMPSKAVQPGDTWPVEFEIPMATLGTMVQDYTFTFQGWEMHGKRNCARLEFQGTIKTKPGADAGPGGVSMSVQDGTCSGVSWFDPELGITIDTIMNQDMDMVITLPPGAGGPHSMTNQMNQVINIKLVSVK